MRILFLGAGYSSARRIAPEHDEGRTYREAGWPMPTGAEIFTLDKNPAAAPHILADLERFDCNNRWSVDDVRRPVDLERSPEGTAWTLRSSYYDEVHAYEILEHIGAQGDVTTFYLQMNELWRILKPGAHLCGTVPSAHSPWAWGDPGHTRILPPQVWAFVDRGVYFPTQPPSSDYRHLSHCDFRVISSWDGGYTHSFCLEAVKPARPFHD